MRTLVPTLMTKLMDSLVNFAKDIKISHSVFALPFAASGVAIDRLKLPTFEQVLLLLGCMVAARTFAMGMNRYLDRAIDAQNPRTCQRMIPSGRISSRESLVWSIVAGIIFIVFTIFLSHLAFLCSVPVLAFLAGYSLLKRVTFLTHFYLGICLGMAPAAVEVALTGSFTNTSLFLGLGIAFWTAGFDILYSLQDLSFDKEFKLKSVPSLFGVRSSLWCSRVAFILCIICFLLAGRLAALGGVYFAGVGFIGAILAYEHWIIRDVSRRGESKHIGTAFFNVNAWVSVVFFVFTVVDIIARQSVIP